ncbi:MAG: hypothetical protein VKJ02_18830 [Snowella sp.]|nr:hypothetical protein [Snowella sp.]
MKILPLLSSVLAVTLAISPAIPLFNSPAVAQATQGGAMSQLNLTTAQQQKLQKIYESSNQRMAKVFTPEQLAQLKAARQQNQQPNLNLTNKQKEQIQTIYKDTRTQIDAVLTPDQKKKLQQMYSDKTKK